MTDDRHRPLREDVRRLGDILGATLRARGGEELLGTVERVRALAKGSRAGGDRDFEELAGVLSSLPVGRALEVARAFAQFLSLANIAEQHHRVRRRRAYRVSPDAPPQPGSPREVFGDLLKAGVEREMLHATVRDLEIELVLTAHPTEAARRTTLQKHRRVASLLAERDRADRTAGERREIDARLERVVLELWETDEIRHERPTPIDEARWGLVVVEQTLWNAVPAFLRSLDRALAACTGEPLPPATSPVRFASWMGGDRDGNPNVTPEVTERTVLLSRWMGADLFRREVETLREELSVRAATEELRARVGGSREPYRELLRGLRDRLVATRREVERRLGEPTAAGQAEPLRDLDGLLEPLLLAHRSLEASGCLELARGTLTDVLRRATSFGLTLLRLDLRQDAARHAAALDVVTRALGLGSYLAWDEPSRVRFLARELESRRPLVPRGLDASPEVRDVLDTFRMAARQPPGALGAYVVSMAGAASDVLAVRLLQRDAGVDPPLRVVPLFETEDDLRRAGEVLDRLLRVEPYRARIGDRQEVMIGYSDSAKDSGRLAAAWALYRAQEHVVEVCRGHGVRPTLFHGRGGSIGRGGGPTWLAIRSQPPGSIDGRLRVTEQGEMIEAKFGIPGIALRTLELYVTGVVSASLRPERDAPPEWRAAMERIAGASSAAYRRRVRDESAFVDYFHAATPIEELGHLRIGSRPARRRPGRDVAALRAIPWVFAWTQMRVMTPTWLGLDEALRQALDGAERDTVLAMYRGWAFFRSTIDLIEMALAKTAPRVAAQYDARLVPERLRPIGEDLRRRLEIAVDVVREITGHERLLEHNPVLRRSIDVRNPYVDPINLVQVELLRRLRDEALPDGERALVRHALLVTVNGVAAGMRNTG